MKIVLQRVTYAQVKVEGEVVGRIDQGYLALVGFTSSDTVDIVEKMASKMIGLRVFSDQEDKMNLALEDVNGAILSISQFTLYADSKKGRRPSFIQAAKGETATMRDTGAIQQRFQFALFALGHLFLGNAGE